MSLSKLPGFNPDTKVAPEGARLANEWKKAKDFEELKSLFPAPVESTDKPDAKKKN
jgi:hypothetical protein